MKKILVFKDRLAFLDHPLAGGMSLSIGLEDGSELQPERVIEIPEVPQETWDGWQKLDKEEALKQIEKTG